MLTIDYDRLGLDAGDRVLDVGAGTGRHAREAARRGARVIAVDLRATDLHSAEGRALMDYLCAHGIPFLAFRAARPGVATGAHVHVGRPSPHV